MTNAVLVRLDRFFANHADIGLLVLRIVIGGHLIWSTQDNVFSWARMLEFRDFLEHFGFPVPLVAAITSVAVQFLGGTALVLGVLTRPAAMLLAINFVVAIIMVDALRPYPAAFPALAIAAACVAILFTGAGRYSTDFRFHRA